MPQVGRTFEDARRERTGRRFRRALRRLNHFGREPPPRPRRKETSRTSGPRPYTGWELAGMGWAVVRGLLGAVLVIAGVAVFLTVSFLGGIILATVGLVIGAGSGRRQHEIETEARLRRIEEQGRESQGP
ncbi:MAG: hypothetical protein R6X20_04825 [Phycisphaerae bacterium]